MCSIMILIEMDIHLYCVNYIYHQIIDEEYELKFYKFLLLSNCRHWSHLAICCAWYWLVHTSFTGRENVWNKTFHTELHEYALIFFNLIPYVIQNGIIDNLPLNIV